MHVFYILVKESHYYWKCSFLRGDVRKKWYYWVVRTTNFPPSKFFPLIPPKLFDSLSLNIPRAEHVALKVLWCFYTFRRLLDRIEAKTKSRGFLTKRCGQGLDPLPLWYIPSKTTTFFDVAPYKSVCLSVRASVSWSVVCHNFLKKAGKFHFHAPFGGALVKS